MRLGVMLPNWVGDVVMATPALRALRKLIGPEGQLIGIMRPYVAEVLEGNPWLDQQILYNKASNRFGLTNPEVFREVRAAQLDRIVLLTNSMRTAWIAWRSGARERIGFGNEGRWLLLTKSLRQPRRPDGGLLPTVEGYLHVTRAADCGPEPAQLELATTAADEQAADAAWQQLRLPDSNRVVILNSGGAYGAAKQWPAEYFAELARRIVRGEEHSVLVNCGPAEREFRAGSRRSRE